MPKIKFDDVTPPEKRSIRNVPIPVNRRRFSTITKPTPIPVSKSTPPPIADPVRTPPPKMEEVVSEINKNKEEREAYEYYYPKHQESQSRLVSGKSSKKVWIYGSATFVVIAIFIVSMMTVFASASVTITPKNQDVQVEMPITANNTPDELSVRYEIIKLSKSKTVSVPATGEEAVELKSSGKVILYNNFSTEPQRLIVRTRLESPEGLIFRIPESIIIPGKTIKDGVETPGSIEVQVFADEAGDKYNIKKSDFTIPGFKTDPVRYKGFYARSSTNMTGGFVGKRKTVAETDKQAALQKLEEEAQADIRKDLESKMIPELTLLSDGVVFKSDELPIQNDGSSVVIGKEVTAYALLLNTQDLSKKITAKYLASSTDWANIQPTIKNFSGLSVKMPANIDAGGKLNLNISGKAKVLADIDIQKVKDRLLKAPKKAAGDLLNEFPGISSISAAVKPIWKQSFPETPAKIYVSVNSPE